MPHSPSGGGCMTPPMSPCPSVTMSTKALRSKLRAIARRRSGLSKGGLPRLTIRLRLTPIGANSQIAFGVLATSFTQPHAEVSVFVIERLEGGIETAEPFKQLPPNQQKSSRAVIHISPE